MIRWLRMCWAIWRARREVEPEHEECLDGGLDPLARLRCPACRR